MARWPYAWRSKALPTQVCSRVLPTDPGSEEYQPRKPVPSHDNSRCLFLSAPSFPAAGQASPPWQPSWITASLTSPLGKVGNIKINFFFFFSHSQRLVTNTSVSLTPGNSSSSSLAPRQRSWHCRGICWQPAVSYLESSSMFLPPAALSARTRENPDEKS